MQRDGTNGCETEEARRIHGSYLQQCTLDLAKEAQKKSR